MNCYLSWAGRKVFIKAVAQAIPTYAMSIFRFSSELCNDIQALINRFWWGHPTNARKIHPAGRDRLCRSTYDGGLAFRDLEAFNCALLARQLWRLMFNTNSLVYRVLQAMYFPRCGLMEAPLRHRSSFTWRTLWGASLDSGGGV